MQYVAACRWHDVPLGMEDSRVFVIPVVLLSLYYGVRVGMASPLPPLTSAECCGASAFSQCSDDVQSHGADGRQESAEHAHDKGKHYALREDARAEAE